jgi:F420-0:gamma-glutamyl ligase-like protein
MRNEIEKVLESMKEDYRRWNMMTRTVHQNVEDFNRAITIREEMISKIC